MTRSIVVIGLGAISSTYIDALGRLPELDILAGVDIKPDARLNFRGSSRPVYASITELLEVQIPKDVIVATPTATHAAVCRELLTSGYKGRIWVEKLVALDMGDAEELLSSEQINVLYHARHAPEIEWAADALPDLAGEHGGMVGLTSMFSDPYRLADHDRVSALVNSWIDSGINCLSALDRLAANLRVERVATSSDWASTFEATIRFGSGEGMTAGQVLTTWHVPQPAKWSHFRFTDGVELFLDHIGIVAVMNSGPGRLLWAWNGDMPRLTAHYVNAFKYSFGANYTRNPDRDLRLHRMVLDPINSTT